MSVMGKGEVSTEQETKEVQLTDLLLDITAPPMEPDDIRIYYSLPGQDTFQGVLYRVYIYPFAFFLFPIYFYLTFHL